MHILIAPNAFKGSLSATEAAQSIAAGFQDSGLEAVLSLVPVADGGDGTATLLIKNKHAKTILAPVHDPLGRLIKAPFGWMAGKKTAIIGMSEASGLKLLKNETPAPLLANTCGTGELIKAALDEGAQRILIGVGGSATVDGGAGMLNALGLRLLDEVQKEILDLPVGLLNLNSIDTRALDKRLRKAELVVLCDVNNPLLGAEGAAKVFGPQKGATENEVDILERCMKKWNRKTIERVDFDMATLKFGGAAGGMAAALAAYTGATLVSGIDFFLDEIQFNRKLKDADLVITGEGKIDEQTLEGKGPLGVAKRAREKGIRTVALAGQVFCEPDSSLHDYFDHLIAINPPGSSLEKAMKNTALHLRQAVYSFANEVLINSL